MKHLCNIEKSAFRAGYVGYGAGRVWRISREGKGWLAYAGGYAMHGPSLGYISERLADPVLSQAMNVEGYPCI